MVNKMLTNFAFEGNVGIRFEGKHFDLHSFYSLEGFVVNPASGTVLLKFSSIKEFRDKVHDVQMLTLEFSEITYLEFSPKFCTNTTDSLEEIGFKSPDDRDDNWLKNLEQSEPDDHLFVRLSSLEFFRVRCSAIRVIVH
ncbi:MAG: hypothetical protein V4567_05055 [Pseudomonadota bacterium]